MTSGIELSVLKCPKCMDGMVGGPHSVFLYCGHCSSGYEVTADDQLAAVTVYFARTHRDAGQQAPFWAFDAKLDLIERMNRRNLMSLVENVAGAVGSSSTGRGLIRLFEERGTIRFYVPASFESLSRLASTTLNLTYQQPELEYLNPLPGIPDVTITQEDARTVADYIFVKSEVERKDILKGLSYNLILENPFIIAISF